MGIFCFLNWIRSNSEWHQNRSIGFGLSFRADCKLWIAQVVSPKNNLARISFGISKLKSIQKCCDLVKFNWLCFFFVSRSFKLCSECRTKMRTKKCESSLIRNNLYFDGLGWVEPFYVKYILISVNFPKKGNRCDIVAINRKIDAANRSKSA